MLSGFRERHIRTRGAVNLLYRAAVAAAGTAMVVVGLVMVPLPGPGWLVVFFGLGVLATEFPWAGRLLAWSRREVARWTSRLQALPVAGQVALVVGAVLCTAALVSAYVMWRGVPAWVPGLQV